MLFVTSKQNVYGQTQRVSINIETAGTLSTIVGNNIDLITDLTLTGSLNADDIITIRAMDSLKILNLTDANIVSGGIAYSTKENTITGLSRLKLISVKLPNSLTNIDMGAFYFCTALTSITIPPSVASIGYWAFTGCTSLKEFIVDNNNLNFSSLDGVLFNKDRTALVFFPNSKSTSYEIPDSVTTISIYAFSDCYKLESVTIPNSVKSINDYAFRNCISLTSITLPNGVISIGSNAFQYCSGLTSITIPDGVTSIGQYSFADCKSLTSITLPNGITSIGNNTFENCSGLKSITIPNSVTEIGYYAFQNCSGLTSFRFPDAVNNIKVSSFTGCTNLNEFIVGSNNSNYSTMDGVVFNNDKSKLLLFPNAKSGPYTIPISVGEIGGSAFSNSIGLTSLTIPNSFTTIGAYAFHGFTGLTSVTLPNSVTRIESYSFVGCSGLTSIKIPSNVTKIDGGAFIGCSGLTSIVLPDSITVLDSETFLGCLGLKKIYCQSITPPSLSLYCFSDETIKSSILYVPRGTIDVYKNADIWKDFTTIIEEDVSSATTGDNILLKVIGAYGTIKVQTSEAVKVAIYKVDGQKVFDGLIDQSTELNFRTGIYIVKAVDQSYKVFVD